MSQSPVTQASYGAQQPAAAQSPSSPTAGGSSMSYTNAGAAPIAVSGGAAQSTGYSTQSYHSTGVQPVVTGGDIHSVGSSPAPAATDMQPAHTSADFSHSTAPSAGSQGESRFGNSPGSSEVITSQPTGMDTGAVPPVPH
jgi:hypothetical protein